MSAVRSASSSFSTLRERSSVPESSTTRTQWNPLPTSTPAHTLSSTTTSSVVRLRPRPGSPRRRLPMLRTTLADLY